MDNKLDINSPNYQQPDPPVITPTVPPPAEPPQPQAPPPAPVLPEPEPPTPPKKEGLRSIVSTILILALAPLVAWAMITFVFQSYEVDGQSMENTLYDNDRLIVLKLGKTIARASNKDYVPKRGEIIIFVKKGLSDYNGDRDKQLIKRVVGVPGDRVVVKNGSITVYNDEYPDGFNPDADLEPDTVVGPTTGNVDIVVGDGEVFVAGDNRGNSLDSRTFGTIRSEEIVGKLAFRLLPISRAEAY